MIQRLFSNLTSLSLVVLVGLSFALAYGHTMDVVGDYKIAIAWLKPPRAEIENGIELFVSLASEEDKMMAKTMNQTEKMKIKMSKKIEYVNGIPDLDELKAELVLKGKKIELTLTSDSNIPGRYLSSFVPWAHGNYQINILGKIKDTNVSIALHPAKVRPLPPLKQLHQNIPIQDIVCDDELTLIKKSHKYCAACVKQHTADKLLLQGWILIDEGLEPKNNPRDIEQMARGQ